MDFDGHQLVLVVCGMNELAPVDELNRAIAIVNLYTLTLEARQSSCTNIQVSIKHLFIILSSNELMFLILFVETRTQHLRSHCPWPYDRQLHDQ